MTLSPRWHKVLRDLWGNRGRTILVVLSIAVGVFAVGMISGSQAILKREMNANWAGVNPPSATLYSDPFDEELLWSVRNMPELRDADARRSFTVRFKVGRDAAQWRNLQLYTYANYDDIRILKIRPVSGAWPPPEHEMLIERASLAWMGVKPGDTIVVEAPNRKQRDVRVAGIVHDLSQMSGSWTGAGIGYISFDTLEWFGVSRDFDQLNIVVAENAGDKEHITQVAKKVRDKVETSGRTVYYTWIPKPGEHPAAEVTDPVFLVLGVLGSLSLVVSGFLVINTLQALMAQQTRQIGMMKAVGGQAGQILGIYYSMVLAYGLLALAIAIPLGAVGAHGMAQFMANLINFDIASLSLPSRVLALQAAVGLAIPLLAALYPILSAVHITARQAMSDYGLGNAQRKSGLIDRALERVRGLSRPLLLSLRNTFRQRGRLTLTLITLTLGGAIFIGVFSVQASLLETLDRMYDYTAYDAAVIFQQGHRVEQLESEALKVPGVVKAESWLFGTTRRLHADDTESDAIFIRGMRPNSELVFPTVKEGRWLLPDDENAVVINTFVLRNEKDIKVGDTITLKIQGRDTDWRVVGIMKGTPPAPMAYMNYPYLARLMGSVGRAGVVLAMTDKHDVASQKQVEKALEQHFNGLGLKVSSTETSSSERAQIQARFAVLVQFLMIMAILLAVVGGIGLMGTMSLNVLERTREIGVMRAVGATNGAILKIVIVEGMLVGVLSWLIGSMLAVPLSKVLSDAVGNATMQTGLNYVFSTSGAGLWLLVVVILAGVASMLPARHAAHLSVRETLAYE